MASPPNTLSLSCLQQPTASDISLPLLSSPLHFLEAANSMGMRLYVYVLEAKDLPISSPNHCYAKLQLGRSKTSIRTLIRCTASDPVWNEEFVFRVHDIADELFVSVYHHHEPPSGTVYFAGRVRIPVLSITDQDNQSLPPTWFPLQNLNPGNYTNHNCGKILLTLSLQGRGDDISLTDVSVPSFNRIRDSNEVEDPSTNTDHDSGSPRAPESPQKKKLMKAFANHIERLLRKNGETSKSDKSSDIGTSPSDYEDGMGESFEVGSNFEQAIDTMLSRGSEQEMPEDLHEGVLVDQIYALPSKDLNALLFAPESCLRKELAQVQGIADMQEGSWKWKLGEHSSITRVVSYTKPPSKLVKAVKATEEQTYVKADSGEFAILVVVDTPDVPYGNTFRIEILYKILMGPELASGEESSRLVVSWEMKFHQSTMMKGMIVGGAQQGLKENFDHFATLLAQHAKVMNSGESIEKNHLLATLHGESVSDLELAVDFFWNPTVVSATFLLLYVLVHIHLCEISIPQGLEIDGIDLPDSFGELILSGILIILLQRVHRMVSYFINARLQMGNDHGVKAQGDGWVITVALIEAVNLAALDSSRSSDPFVVFTSNGKTRTSSVQLQTCNPQWNEVLEFDATEELPSVLDVEVFDFDGPFDMASSLGHAEINFLKHTSNELADLWIPLEGKLAMSLQSKFHLRVFLENNKGVDAVKEYLMKMEKEVGKKLDLRSPHKNSAFQKLFRLPSEEFLIKDYLCYLRRKFLLQGRLFLSARIVGFHGNLFGHKTKFLFLWEDIEDIEVLPPSLASVGSPTLVIVLRKGRGEDAQHGAKSHDQEGRLQFYFQSFASFDVASRTIKGLWKARALPSDPKALLTEDHQVGEEVQAVPPENSAFVQSVDANMINIYSADLPVDIKSLLKLFDGGRLERKVMAKSGCLDYTTSQWVAIKPHVSERRVSYKFSQHVSVFGGEVNCTQRKFPLEDDNEWVVVEVIGLQGIPFSDYFRVHIRYQIEEHDDKKDCKCEVYLGMEWLKRSHFRQRITQNINKKFASRLKGIFELIMEEILLASDHTQHH